MRIIQAPVRRIAWIRDSLSVKSYLDLEAPIRKLDRGENKAVVFIGKVGVGIAKEQLEKKRYSRYDMVFLILDKEDTYDGDTEELPGETCAAVRFCGSHTEAPAYYRKLADFIAKHKLIIAGFSKEITMIDYGLTNDTSQFVTEIQIPVEAAI